MTDRSDRGRRAVRYLLLICIVSASSAAAQSEDWRGYPAGEWPLAGGHWGHTRHSTLTQITTSNIADLGGAWVAELDGEVSRSTPVVRNGLMFVTTSTSVRALDAKTGEARWTHRASVGRDEQGRSGRRWSRLRRSERLHAHRAGRADRRASSGAIGSVMTMWPGR